jgi:hypothetical protein
MVVRLKDKYRFALQFADHAANMGIKPYDLARLCQLADDRARYNDRMNTSALYDINYKDREKKAREEIEYIASVNGYDVEWNLYPTFVRRSDKTEFHLPG